MKEYIVTMRSPQSGKEYITIRAISQANAVAAAHRQCARLRSGPEDVNDYDLVACTTRAERDIAIREIARSTAQDQNHMFDPEAEIAEGDDNGAWVQCWRWVSFIDTDLDKDQ